MLWHYHEFVHISFVFVYLVFCVDRCSFWKAKLHAFTVAFVLIIISVSTSVFSYSKIYRKLRRYQLQIHGRVPQGQPNGRHVPMNIARYKKSVFSVLWVHLAGVICYIPFIVVVILMTYGRMPGKKFKITVDVTATLTYLQSYLNPIPYCWRITAV